MLTSAQRRHVRYLALGYVGNPGAIDAYSPEMRERLSELAAGSPASLYSEMMARLMWAMLLAVIFAIAVPLVLLFVLGMDGKDFSPLGVAIAIGSFGPALLLALLVAIGPVSRRVEATLDDNYRLPLPVEHPVDAAILARAGRLNRIMMVIAVALPLVLAVAIYVMLQQK